MAKKRKPASKAATRRTPRRGKAAAAAADGGATTNTSASAEASDTTETTEPSTSETFDTPATTADSSPAPTPSEDPPAEPQAAEAPAINQNLVPTVALHKKFGKYRCLFNNDDTLTRKFDLGSDSETNSSVEIRVVDPCASSESDSNAAPDTHSGGASPSLLHSSTYMEQSCSRDVSPVPMLTENPLPADIPLPSESAPTYQQLDLVQHIELDLVPLPPPLDPEPGPMNSNMVETVTQNSTTENIDLSSIPEPEPISQHIPVDDDQTDYGDDDDDDDEVITIVQIVEDDNPELYYNINIDSPKEQLPTAQETESADTEAKKQDAEFQQHFEQLNIATSVESNISSPMDCSELNNRTPPCGTPDLQFQKDHLDLARPDPSLTPSSTFSDDSTSSRVTEQNQNNSNDSAESSPTGVRRSSRIKTISNMKQKTKGYGLVKTPLKKALITQTKLKLEEMGSDSQEKSSDTIMSATPNSPSFPVPSEMPVKVKSRWRRSSELEMGANSPANSPLASPNLPQKFQPIHESSNQPEEESTPIPMSKENYDRIIEERMRQYQHLDENEYMCERMISKDTKKMICDCFLTKEELERGELACGEDCLNRLLMIECNSRCPVGDRCTNRRFQKKQNALLKVFYADKKGCGVEACVDIPAGEFLMEYVGEVLDYDQFYKRAQAYSDDNNLHHYFMSLKGDTVIDATLKGNISRFINHSCDPNAETQKWTVNGELRIGFFSKRDIVAGEELTFDYQFQRFGKVAQRCYCGADSCRGWIGAEPDSDEDDEEEEEEDVSTSKLTTESSEESRAADASTEQPRERARRPKRERKYKPKAKDLVQDADIEEDLEALTRTGVKNQSHTLRLSRTIVRAKTRRCQVALLRLLRDADLPCRRLFLDYRGLRLLAPWCNDAPLDFRLEMLQTVDRLPVGNKTLVQESRFITIVERWLSPTPVPDSPAHNAFIDEATGLPIDLPNRPAQDNAASVEKSNAAMLEKVKDLSNQLLERWSSLKEVFKIPKKERIQQMKEHERQANVERRAADSSGARDRERREERDRRDERDRDRERDRERERERERERDRYRERERDRERERERERDERDRRKRRGSPDGGRRSIRLSERVLAAVPPMSKEERRRAFAEAAAAAEQARRQRDHYHHTHPPHPYWGHAHDSFAQMFPGGMMPPNMMVPPGMALPPNMVPGMMPQEVPPEYQTAPGFYQPFPGAQPICVPQANMSVMGMSGYGMGGFMFGQQLPAPFPAHPVHPAHPAQAQVQQVQQVQQMQQVQQVQQSPQTQVPQEIPPEEPKEVILPSLWRSAVDSRGRTYYYHVKLRQPQWAPPTPPPHSNDAEESSSEEEDEVRAEDDLVRVPAKGKLVEGVHGIYEVVAKEPHNGLIPEHALVSLRPRKRRPGLVTERPISPRTEEDKLAGRMEVKRYRQTKEKLRRRREKLLQRVRLLATAPRASAAAINIDLADTDSDSEDSDEAQVTLPPVPQVLLAPPEASPIPAKPVTPPEEEPPAEAEVPQVDAEEVARKIKEQFRSAMARVMVQHLNPYRHSEAKAGRITNTADFKHLARKLTHFVMLKELKHCRSVEELVVTDSVRSKAKMFVKKYMAKFGPVYRRPPEEAD